MYYKHNDKQRNEFIDERMVAVDHLPSGIKEDDVFKVFM